jgi:hypothetical protein
MNNLITLLFSLFILTFSSCSKNDDSNQNIDGTLLIGKWKIVSIKNNNEVMNLDNCSTGTYKEYKTDNRYYEHYLCGTTSYLDPSDYSLSNNKITYVFDDPGLDEPIFTVNVDELTNNSLITSFQREGNGSSINVVIVYTKI